jgi:6-phosphogluconolactonase
MPTRSPTEHLHSDATAWTAALAARLATLISDAVAARDRAVLVLAGGASPLPVYRELALLPLPWSAVTVLPSDERWVDAGHPARNDRALDDCFADAAGITILPLAPPQAGPSPSSATAEASLAGLPAFDAVVLGMGNDAHTASLFPGVAGLAAALDADGSADAAVLWPEPLPPEAPFARVSLTASRLLRSRCLLLAIGGESKWSVWQAACAADDPLQAPISLFARQQRVPLEIHWSP